jgi:hypothetical protein
MTDSGLGWAGRQRRKKTSGSISAYSACLHLAEVRQKHGKIGIGQSRRNAIKEKTRMTKPSASCGPYGMRIIEVSSDCTMRSFDWGSGRLRRRCPDDDKLQELPAVKTQKSDEEIDRSNS